MTGVHCLFPCQLSDSPQNSFLGVILWRRHVPLPSKIHWERVTFHNCCVNRDGQQLVVLAEILNKQPVSKTHFFHRVLNFCSSSQNRARKKNDTMQVIQLENIITIKHLAYKITGKRISRRQTSYRRSSPRGEGRGVGRLF